MNIIKYCFRHQIFLTPLLWFVELLQNQLYRLIAGDWGWIYPQSPYHWFSFLSLANWSFAVVVYSLLFRWWFDPQAVPAWIRWPVMCVAGFASEFLTGLAWHLATGQYFFIWTHSPLPYIEIWALPLWFSTAILFDLLNRLFDEPENP
jgi:hypothetical protein